MTNREFANAVGCSTTMASRMRNGKRAPSVATLRACIEAFDLDADEALDFAGTAAGWGGFLRSVVFSRTRARASAPAPVVSTAQLIGEISNE